MRYVSSSNTRLGFVFGAVSILCLSANIALAGEITGNGKILKDADGNLHGRSACAFSGLQDDYEEDEGFFRSMIVQNWGQIPKPFRDFLTSIGVSPGYSCNPEKSGG